MITFFELKAPNAKPLQIGFKNDRTLYLPSESHQHFLEAGFDGVSVHIATDSKRPAVFYPAQWLMENSGKTPAQASAYINSFLVSPTQARIVAELEQEGFFDGAEVTA